MNEPFQIRLSGAGGQGLITAGVILAEAALRDGKEVVQTQMYGPSARLGASRSEVIISNEPIAYPEVTNLDLLLCMSQTAFDKYAPMASADTRTVVDASSITFDRSDFENPDRIEGLPLAEVAREVGKKIVANVVALGAVNASEQIVEPESLLAAVRRRVPERFRALNEEALAAGEAMEPTQERVGAH